MRSDATTTQPRAPFVAPAARPAPPPAPAPEPPADPEVRLGRPFRRLGLNLAFWRLFAADAVSSLGDGLVIVAFPLLALTMTTDPVLIAGVAIAGRLPALLCSIPAGALVDRVDRRRLVFLVNVLRFVTLAAFAAVLLAGIDSLPALYATVFVIGTGDLIFSVATQACLPAMVPGQDLPRANGYLATAEVTGQQFVGPAIGGVTFAASRTLPFITDAVSFLASALLVRNTLPGKVQRSDRRPFVADIRAGLRWFLGNRLLRLLAVVVASLAFCQAMVFGELVLYGTHQLHLGHIGYGLFFAGTAIGDVVGSLGAGRIYARWGPARCIIGAAVTAGVAYLVLSATAAVATALVVLFLEAFAVAVGNVTTLSLRQRIIPIELLGRVGSAFRMLVFGLIPLGALTGGLVAAAFGLHTAFRTAGALQLVVLALAGPMLVQRIRRAEQSWSSTATS
jgi:MFS family permease